MAQTPVQLETRSGRPIRRAAAFTLVEILVVVGILALLISIAVIGFRVVGNTSRSRVTGVSLESAKSLFTNFRLTGTAESVLSSDLVGRMCDQNGGINRWQAPLNNQPYDVLNCQVRAPAFSPLPLVVNNGQGTLLATGQRALQDRYLQDETARVMKRLMAVPANSTAVAGLPPDRVLRVRFPADPTVGATVTDAEGKPDYPTGGTVAMVDGVVLLDGNGHPIYFIPGGGLLQVNVGYQGKGDVDDPANYDRANVKVQCDKQPFWASPGPDGDLTTGDDNIYSFDPR